MISPEYDKLTETKVQIGQIQGVVQYYCLSHPCQCNVFSWRNPHFHWKVWFVNVAMLLRAFLYFIRVVRLNDPQRQEGFCQPEFRFNKQDLPDRYCIRLQCPFTKGKLHLTWHTLYAFICVSSVFKGKRKPDL